MPSALLVLVLLITNAVMHWPTFPSHEYVRLDVCSECLQLPSATPQSLGLINTISRCADTIFLPLNLLAMEDRRQTLPIKR